MRNSKAIFLGLAMVLASASCGGDDKAAVTDASVVSTNLDTAATTISAQLTTTTAATPEPTTPAVTETSITRDPSATSTPDGATPADATTVTNPGTSGTATSLAPATGGPTLVDPANAPGAGTAFCEAIQAVSAAADGLDPVFDENPDPVAGQAAFGTFQAELAKLTTVAPAELQGNLKTLTDGFAVLGSALKSFDFNLDDANSDPATADLLEAATGADFDAAGQAVDTYSTSQCGAAIGD
jgi:hypothetical protein